MRHTGSHSPAGAYLAGRYKQAESRKDKLLNVINRLAQVSYEKGTRKSDEVLRGKVKELSAEVEQQYRMIRAFSSARGGDTAAFRDILDFFNRRFLERFILREQCDGVLQEIARQDKIDRDYTEGHPEADHARKLNVFREDLARELQECEKQLLDQADPQLRAFLTEVNEIELYTRISERIDRLITSDDVFVRTGPLYQEFKSALAFFGEIYIKLSRLPFTDAEIIEMINRSLQQAGFRNAMLRSRNINPDIYTEIMMEIIAEGDLRAHVRDYADASRGALDAIRSVEKKKESPFTAQDLVGVLENLIYLEEFREPQRPAGTAAASGLSRNEAERYLFHAPGTFDLSLKFVSEYMRDSMIFILDWLNRELQKAPRSASLLRPVIECIPSIRTFVSYYRLALDVTEDKSNRTGSGPGEKHFISKQIARGLIQSIKDNCVTIKLSLVDASYTLMNSTTDRADVLNKQIGIIKESCNDSYTKISKGLSGIEKV